MKKQSGNEISQAVKNLCKIAKVKTYSSLVNKKVKINFKGSSITPSPVNGFVEETSKIKKVKINYMDKTLPVLIELDLEGALKDSYLCYSKNHKSWMLKQSGYGLWLVELSFPKKWWQIF